MNLAGKVDEASQPLLASIKRRLPEMEELLATANSHWRFEDGFYRFYHQSFKVYGLQAVTLEIAALLESVQPGKKLNGWFRQIILEGTGCDFTPEANSDWLAATRPILEAFFHARTMLELAVKYGRELEHAPAMMPSGWAALLYLYNRRGEGQEPPEGETEFSMFARKGRTAPEIPPFQM